MDFTNITAEYEKVHPYLISLWAYAQAHINELSLYVLGGFFITWFLIGIVVLIRDLRKGKRRKGKRTIMQRLKGIKARLVADVLTDVVEEAVFKGILTRRNAKFLYRRLGEAMGDTDYLPRKTQKNLKKELQAKHGPKLVEQPSKKEMSASQTTFTEIPA